MTRRTITTAEAHERALGRLILWGSLSLLMVGVGIASANDWLPLFF